jgi:myo-inositol-1(or 4)-monophosphatase
MPSHEDQALSANWLEICRRIVEKQKTLFGKSNTLAERDDYEGIGEGGDNTLVLDRQCEDIVFAELEDLAEEGAAFTAISEERGTVQFNGGGETWVVIDPIDGSLNVKRTLPSHSLSLAVGSAPNMAAVEFGYVFDFGPHDEFWAQSGSGAFLNDRQLKVTAAEKLEVVGIEGAEPGGDLLAMLGKLQGEIYRLRCVGSLAITVAYVAANRFDGMVSPHPSRSVDVAAAQLIAREAGAFVALGEDGLTEVGFDLDQRFSVTAANSPEGLQTLLASRDQ